MAVFESETQQVRAVSSLMSWRGLCPKTSEFLIHTTDIWELMFWRRLLVQFIPLSCACDFWTWILFGFGASPAPEKFSGSPVPITASSKPVGNSCYFSPKTV